MKPAARTEQHRSKRISPRKPRPDPWPEWRAKGYTLPPTSVLERLSRGETANPAPEPPGRQLELFPIGGRLVAVPSQPKESTT